MDIQNSLIFHTLSLYLSQLNAKKWIYQSSSLIHVIVRVKTIHVLCEWLKENSRAPGEAHNTGYVYSTYL